MLDALCCVGAGTFAALDQLVGQRDDRPWAARETARALVSLGHLDVELDYHLRPRGWSIAPPMLVASAAGAFLAGWRSPELLFALGRTARALGGRVEWTAQAGGPSRIGLLGVDEDDLDEVALGLREASGLTVTVGRDAPSRLARALPSLSTLRRELPVVPAVPVGEPLEHLDIEALRWVPVGAASVPGAYLTGHRPRVALHSDGNDLRIADTRLAKWLAGGRTPLLAYDRERRRAICHRGTEPPWLYERALVLCSGLLPTPVEGHLMEYADVGSKIATMLAARLAARLEVNA